MMVWKEFANNIAGDALEDDVSHLHIGAYYFDATTQMHGGK